MRAPANGIEIEYESFGDPDDPTLLLVHGIGAQMVSWHPDFCEALVDRGFRVVRMDNRDVGLSSRLGGVVDITAAVATMFAGGAVDVPYHLSDMADDGWGLLDHLGVEQAHLMGASMGGMIVQEMAIGHPERVLSLTSHMSTTGDPDVGQPTGEALAILVAEAPEERQAYLDLSVEQSRFLSGPVHADDDWARERAALAYDRGLDPDGVARQFLAVVTSPPRSAALRELALPALVVHGEVDPLIDISGGVRTAECLAGSEFLRLSDTGHDLPRYHWATVIEHVTALAARSAA